MRLLPFLFLLVAGGASGDYCPDGYHAELFFNPEECEDMWIAGTGSRTHWYCCQRTRQLPCPEECSKFSPENWNPNVVWSQPGDDSIIFKGDPE